MRRMDGILQFPKVSTAVLLKTTLMIVAVSPDLRLDEKTISRPTSPPPDADQTGQVLSTQLKKYPHNIHLYQTSQIVQYIGDTALPRLRKFLVDNDRVLAVCTNVVYYIVSPALKTKSRYGTTTLLRLHR
jgi:hypothetical protein